MKPKHEQKRILYYEMGGLLKQFFRKIKFPYSTGKMQRNLFRLVQHREGFNLGLLKVLCGDLLNNNHTEITETVSY